MSERQVIRISDDLAHEFAKIEGDLIQARLAFKEACESHRATVERIKARRDNFWRKAQERHQLPEGKEFSVQLRRGRALLVERTSNFGGIVYGKTS